MPKKLPATPANLYKYQKYLNSLKRYLKEGEEMGYVLDTPRRLKYEQLFSLNELANIDLSKDENLIENLKE